MLRELLLQLLAVEHLVRGRGRVGVRVRVTVGARVGVRVKSSLASRRSPLTSPLHLPYISPTSPLHLRYISATSPPPHSPAGARQWPRCANARAAPQGRRTYGGDIGEMQGKCRGDAGEIWASLCQSSRAGSALTRSALASPRGAALELVRAAPPGGRTRVGQGLGPGLGLGVGVGLRTLTLAL